MKSIRFLADFYAVDGAGNSFVKYAKGGVYPVNEETAGQVSAGFAEEVETPDVAATASTAQSASVSKSAVQATDGA